MTQDRTDETYDVGEATQTQPIQEGSIGKSEGAAERNLSTVLERTWCEKVAIDKNGRRKRVTKLDAVIVKLVNEAASGDSHSTRLLCQLITSRKERRLLSRPKNSCQKPTKRS